MDDLVVDWYYGKQWGVDSHREAVLCLTVLLLQHSLRGTLDTADIGHRFGTLQDRLFPICKSLFLSCFYLFVLGPSSCLHRLLRVAHAFDCTDM